MICFFISRLHEKTILSVGFRGATLASVVGLLGGCGTLGSATIVGSRTPVNEAVATTARQQTLMNIVRVYHNEAPLILDVVEADEMVAVGASPTGGASGIGAIAGTMGGTLAGRTESASGIITASDGVTNRYVPLQGQALHSQLSTPITVETVNALYDSDWPLQSILDFAYDRITPSQDDYRLAVDLLTSLDNQDAIALATAKSGFSMEPSRDKTLKMGNVTINTQPNEPGGGDTLNIYKAPGSKISATSKPQNGKRAWSLLTGLYRGTQPDNSGQRVFDQGTVPSLIELRSSPRSHLTEVNLAYGNGPYLGPVARTRTAVGILKYLVTQPKIAFLTLDEYESIIGEPWNSAPEHQHCPSADYYIINPANIPASQTYDPELYNDEARENRYKSQYSFILKFLKKTASEISECPFDYVNHAEGNRIFKSNLNDFSIAMGSLERNILIVKSEFSIPGASISWNDGLTYYSIMREDIISQRNLMLVSQFLTIQATSTPSPSLTTISPSGR